MEFIKNNIKYLVLFIFFVFILNVVCFENTSFDFMWEYGFSHALRVGERPYLDFNTIVTPLYIFLMSLPLYIHDSFMVYIIFQAFLDTLCFYIIFKYLGKRGWLLLPILSFPFFVSFIGTYNFFTFLLLILLCYVEENSNNDYLLGILLGLLFLSKQTVGLISILTCIYFLRDLGRIIKRIIGISIPIVIFLIYLLLTSTLFSFIDLCFLGLLNFGGENGSFKILMIPSFIILIILSIMGVKNKNIIFSYVIASFAFVVPLFDYSHFILFLSMVSIPLIKRISNENKCFYISIILISIILFMNIIVKLDFYKELVFLDLPHFNSYLVQRKDKKDFKKIYNKYKKYDNAVMVGTTSMLYDISLDKDITYFDMPLTGNYGYNGTNNMIKKVNNMHNKYFFIDICSYNKIKDSTQLDYKLLTYIIKNTDKIDSVLCYNIYYRK